MPRTTIFMMSFTALAVFLWLGGFAYFASHIRSLPNQSSTAQADAIIVLTGGPDRINTGLNLLKDKRAPRLFISGVNKTVSVDGLLSLWGQANGKPPCCITLGYKAQNTTQNARESKEWVETENISSFILVTAAYHMPRALLEFNHAIPGQTIAVHSLPLNKDNKSTKDFWFLIMSEYNKTIATWLRYHLGVSSPS